MKNVLQTAGNIVTNSWRYLPFGSLINHMNEIKDRYRINPFAPEEEFIDVLKMFAHVGYLLIALTALSSEVDGFIKTGEINPLTQNQVILQRTKEAERKREAEGARYNFAYERLFGKDGLADTDKDGRISPGERFETFRRMGLEGQVQFPQPKIQDLEKAALSYNH